MTQKPESKDLTYTAFIYEEHLTPNGCLPREVRVEVSAAWHFCRLAIPMLKEIPEQVVEEGEKDLTIRLNDLTHSVAIMYDISDRADFLCHLVFCKREAKRLGYWWPERLDAWIDSGGRAFDEVTREPGALNKS